LGLSTNDLAYWEGRVPTPETRALFADLRMLRAEQADLRAQIATLEQTEEDLIADQDRLARLIAQLGDDSGANMDRRARVDAIDAEIEAVREEKEALQAALQDADARMRAMVQ
jgi:prefoldin subunit 5